MIKFENAILSTMKSSRMLIKQDRLIGVFGSYYKVFNDGNTARKFDKEHYTGRMFRVMDVDGNHFLAYPVIWDPDVKYFRGLKNADLWRGEIL